MEHFASLAAVIRHAEPADKAEIYRGLNLVLTYQPGSPHAAVRAEAQLSTDSHGVMVGWLVSEGERTNKPWLLAGEVALAGPGVSGRADRWIRRTTIGCVTNLALIAGTVSYLHMHALVALHGQPGWVAARGRPVAAGSRANECLECLVERIAGVGCGVASAR